MTEQTPQLRTSPDHSVSTASRVPTLPELEPMDRFIGWLRVNRLTYRALRLLLPLRGAPVDVPGTSVDDNPELGQGTLFIRPDTVSGQGAVMFIHGGGYVLGTRHSIQFEAADLAARAQVPVICPGYRLAPQAPFPAGLDDCHAAWHWLQDNAQAQGIDPTRIVIAGTSAGGGLAAALAQRLRDEGGVQPVGQLLIYPMLDDQTAANRAFDTPRHRVWSNRNNLFGWRSYLGHAPGQPSPAPYAVPARRDDLTGLPPTWIGVGTSDLFLDEDRTYAQRLGDAQVDVTYVEADGAIHGFNAAPTPVGQALRSSQAAFVKRLTQPDQSTS